MSTNWQCRPSNAADIHRHIEYFREERCLYVTFIVRLWRSKRVVISVWVEGETVGVVWMLLNCGTKTLKILIFQRNDIVLNIALPFMVLIVIDLWWNVLRLRCYQYFFCRLLRLFNFSTWNIFSFFYSGPISPFHFFFFLCFFFFLIYWPFVYSSFQHLLKCLA